MPEPAGGKRGRSYWLPRNSSCPPLPGMGLEWMLFGTANSEVSLVLPRSIPTRLRLRRLQSMVKTRRGCDLFLLHVALATSLDLSWFVPIGLLRVKYQLKLIVTLREQRL